MKLWRWLKRMFWHEHIPKPDAPPEQLFVPAKFTAITQQAIEELERQHSDRDLLSDDERALFEQLAPADPDKVIAYPAPAEDQSARDWVTAELERRTGGLTRHPLDMTDYPEPPTAADLAAQERFRPGARAMFSHGMSMRYLRELQRRAEAKDKTLSTEDLMALRSRGLI